jgi:hypothetical protein
MSTWPLPSSSSALKRSSSSLSVNSPSSRSRTKTQNSPKSSLPSWSASAASRSIAFCRMPVSKSSSPVPASSPSAAACCAFGGGDGRASLALEGLAVRSRGDETDFASSDLGAYPGPMSMRLRYERGGRSPRPYQLFFLTHCSPTSRCSCRQRSTAALALTRRRSSSSRRFSGESGIGGGGIPGIETPRCHASYIG